MKRPTNWSLYPQGLTQFKPQTEQFSVFHEQDQGGPDSSLGPVLQRSCPHRRLLEREQARRVGQALLRQPELLSDIQKFKSSILIHLFWKNKNTKMIRFLNFKLTSCSFFYLKINSSARLSRSFFLTRENRLFSKKFSRRILAAAPRNFWKI